MEKVIAGLADLGAGPKSRLSDYPFPQLCLVPLRLRSGEAFAAVLLARDAPWTEAETPMLSRIGATFAHAWQALSGRRKLRTPAWRRYLTPAVVGVMLAVGLIPVPLTALAPVEVAGRDASVVSH